MDFNSEYFIPEIENLAFHFPHVYILGKKHCEGKQHDIFVSQHNNFDCKRSRDYAEICQVLSEQVHSQYFYGCKYIYIEGVALGHYEN